VLLLFRGKLAIRAKFAGKILEVIRRVILLTSIILSRVVILVGIIVGFCSRGVFGIVIGTTRIVVGIVVTVLIRRRTEEPPELWFKPKAFLQLGSISLKFQY